MRAIKALCTLDSDFVSHISIEFIGKVNSSFKDFVKNDQQLSAITRFTDQVPHDQLLKLYGTTDLQLLVLAHTSIAPGNLPGKFFEYLASGKPILGIGPADGDAAEILLQSNAGLIRERSDSEGIKSGLMQYYTEWKKGNGKLTGNIQWYSRRCLTERLVSILRSE